MLDKLSTIDTCEAIAMIACTRLDVLAELAEMVVEEDVGGVDAEPGLNAPGMARNAMFALSKTAAWFFKDLVSRPNLTQKGRRKHTLMTMAVQSSFTLSKKGFHSSIVKRSSNVRCSSL